MWPQDSLVLVMERLRGFFPEQQLFIRVPGPDDVDVPNEGVDFFQCDEGHVHMTIDPSIPYMLLIITYLHAVALTRMDPETRDIAVQAEAVWQRVQDCFSTEHRWRVRTLLDRNVAITERAIGNPCLH